MNKEYFDEITATLTLITIDGVIPSLLEFQYQINKRIEKLSDALRMHGHNEQSVDALQRLICLVIDIQTKKNLMPQGIKWDGYELEHIFYGYNNEILFDRSHAAAVFNIETFEIAHYAVQLITLAPIQFNDRKIQQMYMSTADALNGYADPNYVQGSECETTISKQEISYEETTEKCRFWLPFLAQISASILLLIILWLSCWYFLRESI
ncbi:hypothetical protein SAMN05216516_110105 [Izhakiella capsodis]|uniref:Type IV / VI secretion system DotU domain-containing protein n=1 Tax=Izhakiella capsodis TaxID=1367852 RepID=A0A1I5A242_9GAMM|nr:hypothetical protein [Izhakiella capsodis]SFN56410.1 hypothetical protein SAMN05216516_110105 [Izhakiella capsodis]